VLAVDDEKSKRREEPRRESGFPGPGPGLGWGVSAKVSDIGLRDGDLKAVRTEGEVRASSLGPLCLAGDPK